MRKPATLLTADRHRQGFTLIELSLTMILSSLLVGLSVTLLWRAHQA
ncbi:MAG: prepilin-type N-terminal cleavage/methylation domain-containing protein, partial [Planctomycetota bacterium]